jgi:hypothetical protein
MGNSALVPLSTLDQIVELLGYLDTSNLGGFIGNMLRGVLQELKTKVQKSELREDYAKVIRARIDGARVEALTRYLDQKQKVGVAKDPLSDEERLFQAYYNKVYRSK